MLGKQAPIADSAGGKAPGSSAPAPGKTTLVQQVVQRAPAADKPAAPVWVEFDHDGNWNAADVLATLGSQAAVPEDLKAAIMAGPKATASYCAALRTRVAAGERDDPKKEQISNALTSRITELALATPQSPLQYSQLVDVARWSDQYKAAGAPAAPSANATTPPAQAGAATAGKADQAAETYATKLAQASARDTAKGDTRLPTSSDPKPGWTSKENDEHGGEESGNTELTGWRFIHDPFDNTVTAVRPDGTDDNAGLLFTFQVDGGAATLVGSPLVLTRFRVAILKRQDAIKGTEAQEKDKNGKADPSKAAARVAQDQAWTAADRKYDADHAAWEKGGRNGPEPQKPTDHLYLSVDHRTTMCNLFPSTIYRDAGGGQNDFSFDPKAQQKATPPPIWKTLDSAPDGPKPGDVCYLLFLSGATSHMGVFKSKAPIPNKPDQEMWVMTDGGQGDYDKVQLAQERTRRFEKSTQIFRDSAEGGQRPGDRKLAGWIDLDEYRKQQQAKQPQTTSV